jgi:hypothetical protein
MSYPRVPDSLLPQMIWRPVDDDARTPAVVYLADRSRRRETVGAASAATVLSVISFFIPSPAVFAVIGAAAVLLLFSLIRYRNGRSGFYQVTAAGEVGAYLGRDAPDLAGYQRQRLRRRKGQPAEGG